MKKNKNNRPNYLEFEMIISDIVSNSEVQKMKEFIHHNETNCFKHSIHVAYYTYAICKRLNLDYKSAARGAMLHDLFLYDWKVQQDDQKGLHAFTHPKKALENASKLFELNEIEKDMIIKHMWPVTIRLPKFLESFIIVFTDKYAAIEESFEPLMKTIYRNSYLLLVMKGIFVQ